MAVIVANKISIKRNKPIIIIFCMIEFTIAMDFHFTKEEI